MAGGEEGGMLRAVELLGGVNSTITARSLYKKWKRTTEGSGSPLWWAASAVCNGNAGGLDMARLLIEKGADVNAVGKVDGGDVVTPHVVTPLWWAARAVRRGWTWRGC
jgi:hypothetical protein